MSDNRKLRGPQDRRTVAGQQAYEVDHLARKLQPQFPNKSRAEIERAIVEATKVKQFHNQRSMIENAAKGKLGKLPWKE